MNVIFTCGGTGGHINPAIAVANMWKQRHPDGNILFIGATGHMEEKLVPEAGFELKTFSTSGMCRKLNFSGIKKNCKAVTDVLAAVKGCKKIYKEFKPDIIVGTGGYASFPALLAGKQMKIPTCVHEANAMPGLTTRMAASWASKVLICYEESARHYKKPEKCIAVGMPVRMDFVKGMTKQEARQKLGLDSRPVILSTFGSQGAKMMNLATADFMKLEQAQGFPYQHIHGVGSFGWEWFPGKLEELGVDGKNPSLDVREYIYNMPEVMAAADVVISRAGASACNEIAASGTPCILIPSPNVTDNHQEKNARAVAEKGGAVVMLEKDCSAQALWDAVEAILADKENYDRMCTAMRSACVLDSTERICDIMEQTI